MSRWNTFKETAKFALSLLWEIAIRIWLGWLIYSGLFGLLGEKWYFGVLLIAGSVGFIIVHLEMRITLSKDKAESDTDALNRKLDLQAAENSANHLRIQDTLRRIEIRLEKTEKSEI